MSRARNFPPAIRQFAAWVLALLASAMLAGAGHAQEMPPKALYGDENIAADLFAAVSVNPYFSFWLRASQPGELSFVWRGDKGFEQRETRLLNFI